ncbi:LysR family transcriptional regulator [Paraburkholderia susongensis]|uniref:DNA-binding transcriptional regulator, LysR family n=1 Tax=Paraburkholderia susongensis TaxID=1515439 RepID=A0A1X7LXE9_9BURK|nr:LysR substrate-binding domain-containing protein [Paraburkholderia susongensis]SMG58568.1 DNA-binding transcriptional regulator, LysR family [Paraburkholderia susongensis]
MKLHQLQVFLSVVEQGSLHGAARALKLSPPAITVTMRELEKLLGVPLVTRSVNGVKLTEYGALFQRRARLLVSDMRRTQDELIAMRDSRGGQVSITVSSVVAGALAPQAFAAFRGSMPNTSVVFRESPLPAALNALHDGETDFAVVNCVPGTQWPDFVEQKSILSIPLFAVSRQGHPLARVRTLKRLLESEWLLPCEPGDDVDKAFARYFGQQGLPVPQRILRCQSLFPTIMLLKTTDLIGIVTEPTFRLEMAHHKITALHVAEAFPDTTVSTVVRRDRPLTSAAQRFLCCFEDVAKRLAHERGRR